MYKRLLLILIILFTVSVSITCGQTIVTGSFYSQALEEERAYQVYLPEGYDDGSKRYPVVYFLHGLGLTHMDYFILFTIWRSLINNGTIQPLIIVKPNGYCEPYSGSWYTNSELYGDFEDYIVYDLITHIDTTFRTLATRDKRTLLGHSMGGFGAMKLGLYHPDIYCGWASHGGYINPEPDSLIIQEVLDENGGSGPFYPNAGDFSYIMFSFAGAVSPDLDNEYFVDLHIDDQGNHIDSVWSKWLLHWPAAIDSLDPLVWDQAIYFDCGTLDETHVYVNNLAFADTLDRRGLEYEFQSFVGGHNVPSRFNVSLAFLDSVMQATTGIDDNDDTVKLPKQSLLRQNFPNPFNPSTTISFEIKGTAHAKQSVRLFIYDIRGRLVRTLIDSELEAGGHMIHWDGRDNNGQQVSSGIYFYSLRYGDMTCTRKMVMSK
ncbi:MAG: alpha/beta hydrolase-fold protein [Candidatus Glassbacteria bacterium]